MLLFLKSIGILILLLNFSGIAFLFYQAFFGKKENLPSKKKKGTEKKSSGNKNKDESEIKVKSGEIVSDKDDLLKDMDLSEIDNLNLDDFE